MIERVARLRGRRPLILEVPFLTPRLSSLWLHLVTPVKAGVARPLVDGLRTETVAHDERIRRLVPFALTPFDRAARTALADAGSRLTRSAAAVHEKGSRGAPRRGRCQVWCAVDGHRDWGMRATLRVVPRR